MCFGGDPTPTQPTVDPAAERAAADAAAAAKANQQLLTDARRKRAQKGLLASDSLDSNGNVLSAGKPAAPVPASSVLGSGGA